MHTCIAFVWKLQVLLHTRMLVYKMYGYVYIYILFNAQLGIRQGDKLYKCVISQSTYTPIPLP